MIVNPRSENWRAPVRRKGKYISNTFRRRADADTWALETEWTIDKGFDPKAIIPSSVKTFAEIMDLDVEDMLEVGKRVKRSKAVLELPKLTLGHYKLRELTRSALTDYAKNARTSYSNPLSIHQRFLQQSSQALSNSEYIIRQIRTKVSLNENRMRN